jgi:hypothetical protein
VSGEGQRRAGSTAGDRDLRQLGLGCQSTVPLDHVDQGQAGRHAEVAFEDVASLAGPDQTRSPGRP